MADPNPNKGFLDFNQIFQKVYDEDLERLRVESSATVILPDDIDVSIDHTEDSIRIGDGTNLIDSTVNDGVRGINVYVVGLTLSGVKEGIKTHKITVTSTSSAIIVSPIANRKAVSIRNWGSNIIYLGEDNLVGTDGYPKRKNEEIVLDIASTVSMTLYAVCDSGKTSELRVIELA